MEHKPRVAGLPVLDARQGFPEEAVFEADAIGPEGRLPEQMPEFAFELVVIGVGDADRPSCTVNIPRGSSPTARPVILGVHPSSDLPSKIRCHLASGAGAVAGGGGAAQPTSASAVRIKNLMRRTAPSRWCPPHHRRRPARRQVPPNPLRHPGLRSGICLTRHPGLACPDGNQGSGIHLHFFNLRAIFAPYRPSEIVGRYLRRELEGLGENPISQPRLLFT